MEERRGEEEEEGEEGERGILILGMMVREERGRRGSGKGWERGLASVGFGLSSNFEKFPSHF